VSAVSGFICGSVPPTTVDVGGGALKIAADASVVRGSAMFSRTQHVTAIISVIHLQQTRFTKFQVKFWGKMFDKYFLMGDERTR